jgi:hypothetical protein
MKPIALLAALLAGCWTAQPREPAAPPPPARPQPELTIELAPPGLGSRPPGELPEITVEIVNRSRTRTFQVPRPSGDAYLGMHAPLRYVFEQARADGTWEPMSQSFWMGHAVNEPIAPLVLRPGERVSIADRLPRLAFPEDVVGRMRARLIYDVDAELSRASHTTTSYDFVGTLTSNAIEIDQRAHPLELRLELIGRVVAGQPIDVDKTFRVTLRNNFKHDVQIYGPGGTTASLGFDLEKVNGGVWPKGDRPYPRLAPDPAPTRTLRPGEVVEIYGPRPVFTPPLVTWSYPAAETFRMRAMYSQPGRPTILYSDWVTVTSVLK